MDIVTGKKSLKNEITRSIVPDTPYQRGPGGIEMDRNITHAVSLTLNSDTALTEFDIKDQGDEYLDLS